MEEKSKKTFNQYMRSLHRDIGFFVVGLTIIYALSGIVLVFRDTNFLKHEILIEKKLTPNLNESQLGKAIHFKDLKILKTEGGVVFFQNGTYSQITGIVNYSQMELPSLLNKFNNLHRSSGKNLAHWFSAIFGILLFFLAISSFWMFKVETKLFRRGIYTATAGILAAIILLIF